MKRGLQIVALVGIVLMLCTFSFNAHALNYPTKPIRIIVPFPAGGSTDVYARIVAEKLSKNLGHNVIIDNRPGASGIIGTEIMVKSPPDGYTLLITATHIAANLSIYKKMPYDTLKDITCLSMVATLPNVLVAHPSFPANNIPELITMAKKKPGELNFASTGIGGNNHLSGEMFKHMAGIDLEHIPYKGEAPAITDLVGGHVSLMFAGIGTCLPYAKAGKLKILAVTTAQRSTLAPDIPTIAESGVPGYDSSSWFGLFGPANMPKELVDRIYSEFSKVRSDPDVKAKFASAGGEINKVGGDSPEKFTAFVKSEIEKWGKVVKDCGIQMDL